MSCLRSLWSWRCSLLELGEAGCVRGPKIPEHDTYLAMTPNVDKQWAMARATMNFQVRCHKTMPFQEERRSERKLHIEQN